MSEFIKRIANLGIGKETVRGTKVAPDFWLKVLTSDFQDREEVVKSERQRGTVVLHEDQAVAKTWSDGAIEGEIFDRSFALFLLGIMGDLDSSASGDTGVYNHTITLLESSQCPTFTIVEKRSDVEQVAYANSVVESLAMTFDLNDFCKFTANMKGKGKVADTSSPSYVDENPFMAKNVTVKIADTYAGLSAGSTMCIKNLSLNIATTVEDDECLGNTTPTDFLHKEKVITGEMEIYFNSIYERDYALNNTQKALRITAEDTSVTIGTTSHPKIVIDLAKVKFANPEISSDPNEITRVILPFEAYYSETDDLIGQIVVTNTEASY